jgi:hypothetical protein
MKQRIILILFFRFAWHLIRKANEIRLILDSTDQTDNIKIEPDWRNTTKKKRLALGI